MHGNLGSDPCFQLCATSKAPSFNVSNQAPASGTAPRFGSSFSTLETRATGWKRNQTWSGGWPADAGHPERFRSAAAAMQVGAPVLSRIRQPPAADGILSSRICNTSIEPTNADRALSLRLTPNSLILELALGKENAGEGRLQFPRLSRGNQSCPPVRPHPLRRQAGGTLGKCQRIPTDKGCPTPPPSL